MSFFGAFFRALAFLAACFVAVLIVANIGNVICAIGLADIEGQTTRLVFAESQETIRELARVNGQMTIAAIQGETSRTWAREAGDTVRTVAALLAVTVIAGLLIWQGFKTWRRWLAERNEQRRILLMFADQVLPADVGRRVIVEPVGGRLLLRDYSSRRQWTVEAAQATLAQRGLLTAAP